MGARGKRKNLFSREKSRTSPGIFFAASTDRMDRIDQMDDFIFLLMQKVHWVHQVHQVHFKLFFAYLTKGAKSSLLSQTADKPYFMIFQLNKGVSS